MEIKTEEERAADEAKRVADAKAPPSLEDEFRTVLEARDEATMGKVRDLFKGLSVPDRTAVPPVEEGQTPKASGTGSQFGFGDVRSSMSHLYRNLPEQERLIRNEKSDDAMQAWLSAVQNRRMDTADRISRELDDDYASVAGSRATTLYGAADATSGIGDGTGAPVVPLPLANLIVLARNDRARLRQLSTVLTSNANTLRVPTSGVATAAMAAEGATAAQGEPTLASVRLAKKKMQCYFVASDEMLADSSFNIISLFTERAGSAMGALEDVQVCTSNGTAPNITGSLESATITAITEATSTVLIYEDVVRTFFGVPEAYHADTVWLGSAAMMSFLSQILDGNGRPIFTAGSAAPGVVTDSVSASNGVVGQIFGRPVYLVPVTAGSLIIGRMKDYVFLDGGGMTVKVSEDVGFATDTVTWKITQRVDGVLADATSFREVAGIVSVA